MEGLSVIGYSTNQYIICVEVLTTKLTFQWLTPKRHGAD